MILSSPVVLQGWLTDSFAVASPLNGAHPSKTFGNWGKPSNCWVNQQSCMDWM